MLLWLICAACGTRNAISVQAVAEIACCHTCKRLWSTVDLILTIGDGNKCRCTVHILWRVISMLARVGWPPLLPHVPSGVGDALSGTACTTKPMTAKAGTQTLTGSHTWRRGSISVFFKVAMFVACVPEARTAIVANFFIAHCFFKDYMWLKECALFMTASKFHAMLCSHKQ